MYEIYIFGFLFIFCLFACLFSFFIFNFFPREIKRAYSRIQDLEEEFSYLKIVK